MKKQKGYHAARKKIRERLHAERCKDHDQSAERFIADAKQLDEEMRALGFEVEFATSW